MSLIKGQAHSVHSWQFQTKNIQQIYIALQNIVEGLEYNYYIYFT